MPHLIGYVTGTTADPAHYKFLTTLKNFATSNGWTLLMSDETIYDRYIFLKGPGLTGEDPVYVGINTYQNVSNNYYNIAVACATGYISTQDYYSQPQMHRVGIPLAYDRIDYWISLNAQRIVFVCKVGQSYYEHGYIGKFIPYTSPTQQPYPVFCGGMFGYGADTFNLFLLLQNANYTTTSFHEVPYVGWQDGLGTFSYNGAMYGSFNNKWGAATKYKTTGINGITINGNKPVSDIALMIVYNSSSNSQKLVAGIYGVLDGVYQICPYYDSVYAEDTVTIDGINYVAFPSRNSTEAEFLIRMDT